MPIQRTPIQELDMYLNEATPYLNEHPAIKKEVCKAFLAGLWVGIGSIAMQIDNAKEHTTFCLQLLDSMLSVTAPTAGSKADKKLQFVKEQLLERLKML